MSKPSLERRLARTGSRPWLLLALLLFIGGQTLAAEHRHGDQPSLHSDCSACLLSAAGAAAAVDSGGSSSLPALAVIHHHPSTGRSRPAAVRFCDSRAPPRH